MTVARLKWPCVAALALLTPFAALAQDFTDPKVLKVEERINKEFAAADTMAKLEKLKPLFDEAAALGLRKALTLVGFAYKQGWMGYPKDEARALEYLTRAALTEKRPGDTSNPISPLVEIYDARKDEAKAWQWRAVGAAAGVPQMLFDYGYAAAEGEHGVSKNETVGVTMVKQAALDGIGEARVRLAIWYEGGKHGLPLDHDAARHWYMRAMATDATKEWDIKNMIARMDGKPQSWGSYAQPYLTEKERAPVAKTLPAYSRAEVSAETKAYNEWWQKTWGPGGTARQSAMPQSAWPSLSAGARSTAERDQADHEARMNKFYSDWDKEMKRDGY